MRRILIVAAALALLALLLTQLWRPQPVAETPATSSSAQPDSSNASNTARASSLASDAPRQKWRPPPKVSDSGPMRVTSKRSGSR